LKLPKFLLRTEGCYTYLANALKPLLEYEDLKPQVYQNFREAGNTFALLKARDEK
jgi:hypothetical protein